MQDLVNNNDRKKSATCACQYLQFCADAFAAENDHSYSPTCNIRILLASLFIMKKIICLVAFCPLLITAACAQQPDSNYSTADIQNFWNAYDKITTTKDSALQYRYLVSLFIEKGTPGLQAMMKVKHLSAKSYIDAINEYPRFWRSIRANTLQAGRFKEAIAAEVQKLKKIYPELQPAQIYFTIGAFRSGGTTQGKMILIGSELVLTDATTVTDEFPPAYAHLWSYFDSDPTKHIAFTSIHEYVHTQQKTTLTNNLLAQCVMEGVAEFVAVKATGQPSSVPAMTYGTANTEKVRQKFETQLFNPGNGFWLYSDAVNEFGVRDLGYYVGYAICERYYDKAPDKKEALKKMIELDYDNEMDLAGFVDASGYFNVPVQTLKERYDSNRPTVVGQLPFKNHADNVSPAEKLITIEFSAAMNKGYRNFEFGPLGKENALITKKGAFSEDGRSFSFDFELLPGRQYQLVIGQGFRSLDGARLKPYLIDFKTAAQ